MRIINNPIKDLSRKEIRTLLDARMIEEDGSFTDEGEEYLWALTFEVYKARMLAEAEEIVKERREARLGNLNLVGRIDDEE